MAEVNMLNVVIGFFLFVFMVMGGAILVNTTYDNYNITDDNELNNFSSADLNGSLSEFGYDLNDIDAENKPSDTDEGWWGAVVGMINKMEALKGIKLTIENILTSVLTFVPDIVWQLLFGITSFVLVYIGLSAWLRYKP
jgi:hypothetical protein